MSAYRAQVHLDAPVDDVWALVANPATYPEWWPVVVEIRGKTFEVGDVYTQVLKIAGRRLEYSRIIDRRDEFKATETTLPHSVFRRNGARPVSGTVSGERDQKTWRRGRSQTPAP